MVTRTLPLTVIGTGLVLGVAGFTFSRSGGIYTTSITRSAPSCGSCHRSSPGAAAGFPQIDVTLTPTFFALTPGQSLSVTIAATGGQTASTQGGFAMDATAGTFSAGAGTRLWLSGLGITHSTPGNRSWTVGYTAPMTPGLVALYGVVNTVDSNRRSNAGDMWAFHGSDATSTTSTPVRLFVNAPGVTPLGQGCQGSFGNTPVLGAATTPAVGNAGFGLEIRGAAPSSSYLMLIGLNPGFQVDLGAVGVTGCTLYVDNVVGLSGSTGAGNAQRGEGKASFPMPIPPNPTLQGAVLQVQAAIVDNQNGRQVPVTLTNALTLTIQ